MSLAGTSIPSKSYPDKTAVRNMFTVFINLIRGELGLTTLKETCFVNSTAVKIADPYSLAVRTVSCQLAMQATLVDEASHMQ
jgi:hypothetical protein